MNKSRLKDNFIAKAKNIHKGENLDYSEVEYINNRTPVKIIDHDVRPDGTEYGEFWQEPVVHLKGCTHPDISRREQSEKQRYTTASFIEKAKKVHRNKKYN